MTSKRGFTLVEVILAVVIVSTGLFVLLSVTAQALYIADAAKEYETARRLFALIEIEHPIQLDDIDEGSEDGDFDGEAFEGFSWQREIAFEGLEEDELFRITTRINWVIREEETFEEVTTLLHVPTAKTMGYIDEDAAGLE
jgi:prepilin-type N-terminal cleavage/methylation domain-containing protein